MFEGIVKSTECEVVNSRLAIRHEDGATWDYDSLDEFFADYRRFKNYVILRLTGRVHYLEFVFSKSTTSVQVEAPTRSEIERVFACFEEKREVSKIAPSPSASPVVFVGHGRSQAWRDLKDHLQDKHGYKVEAYESGARAGHTIRDILEDMVKNSSFALLVMTGEDEQSNSQIRARQNVIHEAGLFQGRLGFSRAILLLESGVEEFSNVAGVQYIPFSKGNIKECFGEVLATLRREFHSH